MMRKSALAVGVLLTCLGLAALASGMVVIDFVPVGDPGNPPTLEPAPDWQMGERWVGDVAYEYRIGKTEVTAGQYAEFLNAVAATDTYTLYDMGMMNVPGTGMGCQIQRFGAPGSYTYVANRPDLPVNWVDLGDAIRFINWLHHRQPTGAQGLGTTEDGVYFINGGTNAAAMQGALIAGRAANALFHLPSESEWIKAARYDAGTTSYYAYATSSNALPASQAPPGGANSANYNKPLGTPNGDLFDVGSYVASVSPYGTFDQNGNVVEMCDSTYPKLYSSPGSILLGGSLASADFATLVFRNPQNETHRYGFRVAAPAAPPEPQILGLEVFYNGKFADAADPTKRFIAVGQASSMSLLGDDLHGNVTNYAQGITGMRITFTKVVTFSSTVAAAFSYQATPEQSSDKTFTAFTPPTAPGYAADDSSGKTIVTITFTDGEIKNRWLKTIIDASQVSANSEDLDGEMTAPLLFPSGDQTPGGNAEFIIGNRLGDVDANYRCLLNDAISIRNKVSGVLVGISNTFDIDKNARVLLNEAIGARNAVSGTALPALP